MDALRLHFALEEGFAAINQASKGTYLYLTVVSKEAAGSRQLHPCPSLPLVPFSSGLFCMIYCAIEFRLKLCLPGCIRLLNVEAFQALINPSLYSG